MPPEYGVEMPAQGTRLSFADNPTMTDQQRAYVDAMRRYERDMMLAVTGNTFDTAQYAAPDVYYLRILNLRTGNRVPGMTSRAELEAILQEAPRFHSSSAALNFYTAKFLRTSAVIRRDENGAVAVEYLHPTDDTLKWFFQCVPGERRPRQFATFGTANSYADVAQLPYYDEGLGEIVRPALLGSQKRAQAHRSKAGKLQEKQYGKREERAHKLPVVLGAELETAHASGARLDASIMQRYSELYPGVGSAL